MTEQDKLELVDMVADQVMQHRSIANVWQRLEKIHKQQLHILENQRKIASQMNLELE